LISLAWLALIGRRWVLLRCDLPAGAVWVVEPAAIQHAPVRRWALTRSISNWLAVAALVALLAHWLRPQRGLAARHSQGDRSGVLWPLNDRIALALLR